MTKTVLNNFDAGLSLVKSPEMVPTNALRRARGIHRLVRGHVRSREGSALVQAGTAHTIQRFSDDLFHGEGTTLYRNGSSLLTNLSGNRLLFSKMPPQGGIADYLFTLDPNGTSGILRKIDEDGNATNWGIAAPATDPTATALSAYEREIDDMDTNPAGDWNVIVNCTRANEATIVVEGAGSLEIDIPYVAVGVDAAVQRNLTVDLSTFATGETSTDQDYIYFQLYLENPNHMDFIQLDFSLGTTDFSADILSKRMKFADEEDILARPAGVATTENFIDEEQERTWMERYADDEDAPYLQTEREASVLRSTETAVLRPEKGVWQEVYVSKALFHRSGKDTFSGNDPWSQVLAVRFQFQTNVKGGAVLYLDDLKMTGGVGMQGTYKYLVTFRNSTTGSRSNANENPIEVADVIRNRVSLSAIPVSTDAQVDRREIWRTLGDGVLFFKIDDIEDNTTTTYTDAVADFPALISDPDAEFMTSTELPVDNDPPEVSFSWCAGPWNASMFWLSAEAGERGRVYYSPIGRPESVDGFLVVTDDDDPLQCLVIWDNRLYAISESTMFEVVGTNPYESTQAAGKPPGTLYPYTVVATPYGILYQTDRGVALYRGSIIDFPAYENVSSIFSGESVGNFTSFVGSKAEYARKEYVITDGSQTLALDLATGRWRDIGRGFDGMHYASDVEIFYTSFLAMIADFEKKGEVLDCASYGIPFDVEFGHIWRDGDARLFLRNVFIDVDTSNEVLTATLIIDEVETVIGSFQTAGRQRITYPVGKWARTVGIRLAGTLENVVNVYKSVYDWYLPEETEEKQSLSDLLSAGKV